MENENLTPFPAIAWESVDAHRQWHLSALMRVTHRFHAEARRGEWTLRLTPDQGELCERDVFFDDEMRLPVRHESDFVPFKPATDIIVNAVARTATPKTRFPCGAQVFAPDGETLARAEILVTGERWWRKTALGWVADDIQPVTEVPLRYDRAFGGAIPNPDPEQAAQQPFLAEHRLNPVGTGLRHRKMPDTPWREPQLTWRERGRAPADTPAGLGFIHRSWQPRLALAGTYDAAWLETQHPYPPRDFDDRHHQAANPALVLPGYLPPRARFALANLMGADRIDRFHLPELHGFVELDTPAGRQRLCLSVDTVRIDIDAPDPADWRMSVSHRVRIPRPARLDGLRFLWLPTEQLERQAAKNRDGATALGPHIVSRTRSTKSVFEEVTHG